MNANAATSISLFIFASPIIVPRVPVQHRAVAKLHRKKGRIVAATQLYHAVDDVQTQRCFSFETEKLQLTGTMLKSCYTCLARNVDGLLPATVFFARGRRLLR